jgi:hypothetical protein
MPITSIVQHRTVSFSRVCSRDSDNTDRKYYITFSDSEPCSFTPFLNTLYVGVFDSFVHCLYLYLLTNPIPTGKSYVLVTSPSSSASNFIWWCQAIRPRSSNVPNQISAIYNVEHKSYLIKLQYT